MFFFIVIFCERGKIIYYVFCGMLIVYKLRIIYVVCIVFFLIFIFWIKNVVNYKVF